MAVNLSVGVGIGSNAGFIQLQELYMSVINTNISSLNAQRNLSTSQASLSTSMQRLSSGLRINSAKDDAAGLAISDRMTSQIRGSNQAARNANDGISLAQTAEGALGSISDNLQRIRELAVQSANATNSASDRTSINTEAQQLKSEIDRVSTTTKFNGVNLLDGSFSSQDFQVGANAGEVITVAAIANTQSSALGSTSVATLNGVAATGFATAKTGVAGGFTIADGAGTPVDILPVNTNLAAAATQTERTAQMKDAINNQSAKTGVAASIDASSGNLVLTSSHTITVAGTLGGTAGADLGINPAAAAATAVVTNGFGTLDLSSQAGATLGLKYMDSALSSVSTARSTLGAMQNRFTSVVGNLQSSSENLSASRSRIQDADFAQETANLSRSQVLQQAGTAMVAQANQLPQGVLALLR
jgi:flagellin